jgi:hypothetical protein
MGYAESKWNSPAVKESELQRITDRMKLFHHPGSGTKSNKGDRHPATGSPRLNFGSKRDTTLEGASEGGVKNLETCPRSLETKLVNHLPCPGLQLNYPKRSLVL